MYPIFPLIVPLKSARAWGAANIVGAVRCTNGQGQSAARKNGSVFQECVLIGSAGKMVRFFEGVG